MHHNEIRLECLKLAKRVCGLFATEDEIIAVAKKFRDFIYEGTQ